MAFQKVFPVPPPTSNDLTPLQRARLLRKAKKIEQLLGATPHLVDISTTADSALGPIQIALPIHRASFSGQRSSLDLTSTNSSSGSIRRSTSTASVGHRRQVLQHSVASIFYNDRVPVLELPMDSVTLNPPSNRTSLADSACDSPESSTHSEAADRTTFQSPRSSLVLETNFIIPTPNSIRKQKMDRLRKKLGGDVPYHLVFPKGPCAEEAPKPAARESTPAPKVIDKECAPLPPLPTPRARKHAGPRIAHTRDSIVDAASIHRARRQVRVANQTSPPVMGCTGSLASIDFSHVKHSRLSFIIENPDEHKAGLRNEYGLHVSRVSSDDGVDVISEWFGTNINLWGGTTGCETLSERRRRPSSYRKPAPPVPVDCL